MTEDTLARLCADIAFISTPAVLGLEVYHMDDEVLRSKRAMMNQAQRHCLLVNHSRFGQAALHCLASLQEFDHIITDSPPSPEHREVLEPAGLTLSNRKANER